MQTNEWIVHIDGYRFDRFCSVFIPMVSSLKRAKKWINARWILLNGRTVETGRFVKIGDRITLHLPAEVLPQWEFPLQRYWEDEHLAVIHKPPGIPVHSMDSKSLRNALGFNLDGTSEADALVQFEPVHRLDRRTQGLMLIAKTARARARLGDDFATHQDIQKVYQCIAIGKVESGESRTPIDGKEAHSKWQTLSVQPSHFTEWVSLVSVQIFTGRTHQIRKHLFEQGHPILGDDLYTIGSPLRSKGLYLCATGLTFKHPISEQVLSVSISTPTKFIKRLHMEEKRITTEDIHSSKE